MFKKIGAVVVSCAPLCAFAAVDVAPITATLADVALVATAVFGVYVAIKAAKFIRHAL